jgi:LysM repeat protein
MIKARDWITYYRELDGDGGIRSVNNQFVPVTDYTAIEIGNVEHFYVAAFMYSLGGPTDPLWALVTLDACIIWELVVGPARALYTGVEKGLSASQLWSRVLRSLDHNSKQFWEIDMSGIKFGMHHAISSIVVKDLIQQTQEPPPVIESAKKEIYTVVSGDWLSKISLKYYKDALLWPILYDVNKQVIGSNPNRIAPGMKLYIPEINGLTKNELDQYRIRGKNWK